MDIKFVRLAKNISTCEALRELPKDGLHDDFILLKGDIVSNAELGPALKQHFASKNADSEFPTIMTKIFKQLPFSSPLRDPSHEVMLTLDATHNTIVDYGQNTGATQTTIMINKKHINLKRAQTHYKMHVDVVDTEISIVNKELFKHLQEDIELRDLKEEFIINLNTSELTDDKVQAYFLP